MRSVVIPLLALLATLTACQHDLASAQAQTKPEPEPEMMIRLAGVERIEPVVLESYPAQVRVLVHGWLPDGCTSLHGFDQKTEGRVIKMRILTKRPAGVMCTQQIKRFQETYPVETEGLARGTYTLDVNGQQKTFELP